MNVRGQYWLTMISTGNYGGAYRKQKEDNEGRRQQQQLPLLCDHPQAKPPFGTAPNQLMGWDEAWHVFQNNWGWRKGRQSRGESSLVMNGVLLRLNEKYTRLYLDRLENSHITKFK